MTISTLELLVRNHIESRRNPINKALKVNMQNNDEIDEILLAVGVTKIPMEKKLIKDIFGKVANKGINSDKAVAFGASIQA